MKSGHSEKDIDKAFGKRAIINKRETLEKKSNRKQNNKIKFMTEYEPSLPNIYDIWRKKNHVLKNVSEWFAKTNTNTIDSSNIVFYGCYDCRTFVLFVNTRKKRVNIFLVL